MSLLFWLYTLPNIYIYKFCVNGVLIVRLITLLSMIMKKYVRWESQWKMDHRIFLFENQMWQTQHILYVNWKKPVRTGILSIATGVLSIARQTKRLDKLITTWKFIIHKTFSRKIDTFQASKIEYETEYFNNFLLQHPIEESRKFPLLFIRYLQRQSYLIFFEIFPLYG